MIQFPCDKCGTQMSVDDAMAGRAGTCSKCGQTVQVPVAPPTVAAPDPQTPVNLAPPVGAGEPPATSGLAIAALVLGIMGCIPVAGLAAVILGIMAIGAIDRAKIEGRPIGGRGLAVAGIVLGSVFMVIFGISLLIGVLVPALHAARSSANRVKNGTQVGGIVKADILWSAANNRSDDFPGGGEQLAPTSPEPGQPGNLGFTGAGGYGTTTNLRFWALVNPNAGDPLSPKLLINPHGTDSVMTMGRSAATPGGDIPAGTTFGPAQISYAFLDARSPEWKNNTNAGAPIVCDKLVGQGSYWNSKAWVGHVGWGDAHWSYEFMPTVAATILGTSYDSQIWAPNSPTNTGMVNP